MMKPGKKQVYDAIEEFMATNGYAPSIRDICKATGIRSTSTVWYHLNNLRNEGRVTWKDARSRTLRLLG